MFLFVFLFVALGTTSLGMRSTSASSWFSIPALRDALGLESAIRAGADWGEIRYVHTTTRIRADRSTDSAIKGHLRPGESVRADFAVDGWYAVFRPDSRVRREERALGYVYGRLLKSSPPGADSAAP